jgi:hypothetical protein
VTSLRLALIIEMQNDGDFVGVILVYLLNLSTHFVAPNLLFPDGLAGAIWERSERYNWVFS